MTPRTVVVAVERIGSHGEISLFLHSFPQPAGPMRKEEAGVRTVGVLAG